MKHSPGADERSSGVEIVVGFVRRAAVLLVVDLRIVPPPLLAGRAPSAGGGAWDERKGEAHRRSVGERTG